MTSYIHIDSGFSDISELSHDEHHAHEDYIVTLMVAGYVKLKGKQCVNITPGMLTLVPAGMPHALLEGKNMQVHWLSFSGRFFQLDEKNEFMRSFTAIRNGALPICKLAEERVSYVTSLFLEIQTELATGKSHKVLESLIYLMLNEANKASELTAIEINGHTKIDKAMRYIQAHSCEGISLKDVAHALHINSAHLASKMKQATGYSVGQWILKYRLKMAVELLLNTDEKVEIIGYQAGWRDVTHFIRQFKKQYQQTPSAWRRTNKNQTYD
ncbi:AraC family transcriptional regulator [Pseudoalteromonas sp. MMG005]|uniref:AraC family transcriptional regulator n=1 Tax=Pseudoalteromonas sp. MMG005 TaxID=2822682 RepID=UPI001B39EB96|nr:AraC family transcriptional regulator [Pseudoalteromonas sp. MMG005]MBQ4848429.1 helix-turn-helix transcriptional regulator [Pseudoalteromonas sp. MMG005]